MTAPSSERLKSIDELVRQAETLQPDQWLAFLKQACGEDDGLLAQAVHRLKHSSPQWWDHSIESRTFDPSPATPERIGESIGPYRVIRTLGEGGMGEVVLAERDDKQFRRQVAIKLVKRGVLSRNVQGRLKAERQILATLDHPNIARLLDGGASTDGTPYIVMEYIDGEAIDVYCDSRKLTIEARLKLFRIVCAAVHSAHQHLIVHRDLKHSNILVTRDGTPKLLDFGIAKILDERQMIHTMAVTQMDVRVMTPEHASPEQIRGDSVTTVSDVYALGVLLYELLAGHKPYHLKSSRLSEIENAICEQEPLALDASLPYRGDSVDTTMQALCEARSTNIVRLRRDLRGDLANIVMTALRKEPERRYPSVEQFSADIERYLTGMPVAACRDSWQYRANKFVRRHRLAVASASLAVIGLAAFAVTTTIQARRIAREQARAEQVSSFLVDMFDQADPSQSRGKEITVREVLDAGTRRISDELIEQPELRARLLATVGKVYKELGLYDNSERLLRDALEVRLKLFGPDHPETADAMMRLGDTLVALGKLADAEPILTQALRVNRREYGNNSVQAAASLRLVGALKRHQQQMGGAEADLRESLRILKTQAVAPYTELSATLNSLAILLDAKGDNVGAERLYRESLATTKQALGGDHPAIAYNLTNLAVELQKQGKLAEAEPFFVDSLELCRRLFGAEHPETLAALANYGSFLQRKQDLERAESVYREVLQLDRKVRGELHSYVGYDHVNLGLLLYDRKLYPQSEAEFRTALGIYARSLPPNHRYEASARRSLGVTLIALNRGREAEQELKRALEIFAASLANDNPQILTTKGALGKALAAQKRFAEAEPLLLENYRLLVAARGIDNPAAARIRTWIEELYRDWSRPGKAQEFFASLETPANAPQR